jgi:hypothetical protein
LIGPAESNDEKTGGPVINLAFFALARLSDFPLRYLCYRGAT